MIGDAFQIRDVDQLHWTSVSQNHVVASGSRILFSAEPPLFACEAPLFAHADFSPLAQPVAAAANLVADSERMNCI